MVLFQVYIEKQSLTRKQIPPDDLAYRRVVRANTRVEAVDRCLPDIKANVLPLVDPTIKYVSVYVGYKSRALGVSAGRLWPIQIVRETGQRRAQCLT